jgi:hypothetical protein
MSATKLIALSGSPLSALEQMRQGIGEIEELVVLGKTRDGELHFAYSELSENNLFWWIGAITTLMNTDWINACQCQDLE